jgi:hypothetical protein
LERLRAAVGVVGGFASVHAGIALDRIFVAVSLGMLNFGYLSLLGLVRRRGLGIPGCARKQVPVDNKAGMQVLSGAACR